MPVYNEPGTIEEIVRLVLAQRPVQQLIIVDDGSAFETAERLKRVVDIDPRIQLIRHPENKGKGAALGTGFKHATSSVVLIQDADMEYDPTEYYVLLGPILAERADVVFGSRFIGSGPHRVLYFWHSVGNKVITLLSNMATNLNLTDIETGYKMFRRDILQKLVIEEPRFGVEPELTAKVAKLRPRIYEVPISYYGRTYAEGKKIGWRDGFSALRCIVKYNFFRS